MPSRVVFSAVRSVKGFLDKPNDLSRSLCPAGMVSTRESDQPQLGTPMCVKPKSTFFLIGPATDSLRACMRLASNPNWRSFCEASPCEPITAVCNLQPRVQQEGSTQQPAVANPAPSEQRTMVCCDFNRLRSTPPCCNLS